MHPAEIQMELKKRNVLQKHIAQKLGVSEKVVSAQIHGRPVSERLRRAIARAIGQKPRAVWPDYYFSPNRRRRRVRQKKAT